MTLRFLRIPAAIVFGTTLLASPMLAPAQNVAPQSPYGGVTVQDIIARVNDQIISSSYVRGLVSQGSVAEAALGLGRYYSIKGTVVHGFGRGKRLHCPTANLGLIKPEKLSPRDGIYAGIGRLGSEHFPAAISIGYNPTFGEGKHSLEAHLLNFDRDIYGDELELQFVERIRNEKKFASESELVAQIRKDVELTAGIITERGLMRIAP